jgi:hypothetical protein
VIDAYSRNRLSPRYINIATTRCNKLARPQHNLAQKKEKEKQQKQRKESNVHHVGSAKTMMICNRCVLRRIPTTLLALCSSAYQASTFNKGCDDVDAAARTGPRISPYAEGRGKRGTPYALQEGMAPPVGITASVPAFRQGFLLTPKKKKPHPRRSIALHQTRRPPARASTILQSPPPSHRDNSEIDGNENGHPGARNG